MPVGGCMVAEAVVIPLLMLASDGILLAWILAELRDVSLGDTGNDKLQPMAAVALLPGAVAACLLAMPARYLATAILLGSYYLPDSVARTSVGALLRWQLGRGLADIQGVAILMLGLAGGVAWSRGTIEGALRGYVRMVAVEGGHLVALLALAGVFAGALSALAYTLVLSLPASPWALAVADGYAHYATLPVGLLTVAALVELGERALPTAALAEADPMRPVRLANVRDEPLA